MAGEVVLRQGTMMVPPPGRRIVWLFRSNAQCVLEAARVLRRGGQCLILGGPKKVLGELNKLSDVCRIYNRVLPGSLTAAERRRQDNEFGRLLENKQWKHHTPESLAARAEWDESISPALWFAQSFAELRVLDFEFADPFDNDPLVRALETLDLVRAGQAKYFQDPSVAIRISVPHQMKATPLAPTPFATQRESSLRMGLKLPTASRNNPC